jgi:hypothetical protein
MWAILTSLFVLEMVLPNSATENDLARAEVYCAKVLTRHDPQVDAGMFPYQ